MAGAIAIPTVTNSSGLLWPASGQVKPAFSAIFSAFHSFEWLLELDRTDLYEAGNRLLKRLHLQHMVKVSDGSFITLALSQGKAVLMISRDERYFHLGDHQQYAMSIRDAHCRGAMHRTASGPLTARFHVC